MKILLTIAMVLVLSAPAFAQDWFWGLTWGAAFPGGETRDYITNESFRNFGLEGRKFTSPHLSLGLSFNWSVFNEETDAISQIRGGAVSGTQFRYINAFPLLATAHTYLGDDEGTQLYLGAGVGAYYVEQRTEIGLFAVTEDNWHFGVAPEAGLSFAMGWQARFLVMTRYNFVAETDGREYQWWEVRIGIVSM
jgi:opacity protein-like surface antigen